MFNLLKTFIKRSLRSSSLEIPLKEAQLSSQAWMLICLLTINSEKLKKLKRKSSIMLLQNLSFHKQNCLRIIIHWWWKNLQIKQISINLGKKKQQRLKRNKVLTMPIMFIIDQLLLNNWSSLSSDWKWKSKKVLENLKNYSNLPKELQSWFNEDKCLTKRKVKIERVQLTFLIDFTKRRTNETSRKK